MLLSLVTAPAVEPISLDDVRLHLGKTTEDEDPLLQSLIVTAREFAENHARRSLLTQTWDLQLDTFPGSTQHLEIPRPPLQSVTSVTYLDQGGVSQTLSPSLYTVFGTYTPSANVPANPHAMPGYIEPIFGTFFPVTRPVANAVTVRFVAGYGATGDAVPAGILSAMKIMIGTWFGPGRQSVMAEMRVTPDLVPHTADLLLWPFKVAS